MGSVMEMLNSKSRQETVLSDWYKSTTYEEAKGIIRDELGSIKKSFIQIGYFLRIIRETEGYRMDGYESIWEFAEDQYGIKRSAASRWMEMNERFSVGGNSPYLAEEYQEYNRSQLQEMLYLPEEQLEEIKPEMTVKEIREKKNMKDEIQEECAMPNIPGQMSVQDYPELLPAEPVNEMVPHPDQTNNNMIVQPIIEECATSHIEGTEKPRKRFKNDEERKAFIDSYATWRIWIDIQETGERYYRFDFEDGSSFVVKVYFHKVFDHEAHGSWESRFKPGWGSEEYYILEEGKYFKDCKSNRSALVAYLKEMKI